MSKIKGYLYSADYSTGSYGKPYKDWRFTTNAAATVGAAKVVPLVKQRQPLTEDKVWSNDEFMALNAELGLLMSKLMQLVRAVEKMHEIT